ncbi:hypothetical protein M3193_02425 [Sporosarcina luteola]|uniref:hypothetical protein n=1 Tax=Sporosarcina luteola TaxID=582850 RepID=UPI002041D8BB|nr:hypothetical protein [Sporosarcina luteola]MCM3742989.1 hypothetical protein [Sporosarcina luteola]
MTNNQWDDNKLESLLHSLPKIEDNRSKEQILERLKRDQRLRKPHRMKPRKWMPILVTAAALVLLSLLVPSMLKNNEEAIEDAESVSFDAKRANDTENEAMEESADTFSVSEAKESTAMDFAAVESHVVLQDELFDVIPFQIGLEQSAYIVPITFLIPDSLIQSDFPKGNPTTVDLYNKYAAEFPEEELGFNDYHPYKGRLYEENGILHHQLPDEHNYEMSSSTVFNYFSSMRETFSGYEKLQLVDETGKPTSFPSVGDSNVMDLKRPFPYYRFTTPSGKAYLAPLGTIESVDTVTQGLSAMKNKVNGDTYESLVPDNVEYEVRVEDNIAVITFTEQLDVTALEQNAVNQMIEGFMLTAQGYDKQVRLENVVQESFGKYDLTKALPMPVGSNPTWFTP